MTCRLTSQITRLSWPLAVALSCSLIGCGSSAEQVDIADEKGEENPSPDAGSPDTGSPSEDPDDDESADTSEDDPISPDTGVADAGDTGDTGDTGEVGPDGGSSSSSSSGPPRSMYAPGTAGGASSSSNFEARIRLEPNRVKTTSSSNYRIALHPPLH